MRKAMAAGGFVVLALILVSIGQSLTAPPQEQCDACGELMVESERVQGDGWLRVEYRCACGKLGTLAIREDGRQNWWEWEQ